MAVTSHAQTMRNVIFGICVLSFFYINTQKCNNGRKQQKK